jgi:hypothetical protein
MKFLNMEAKHKNVVNSLKEKDKHVMNNTYIYLRAEGNRNPSEENVMENTCEVQ